MTLNQPFRFIRAQPEPHRTQVAIAALENVTDGSALDDKPRWSPNGDLMYLLSNREGFTCIWAQPLDPETKQPAGAAFAVQHFHHTQRSPGAVHVVMLDRDVARDKIVIPLAELSGNIWLMERVEAGSDDRP